MRSLALLLFLAGGVVLASAQQEVSHFGGGHGYSGGGGGGYKPAMSVYNERTKLYEPVTSDKHYSYFRFKLSLNYTFIDRFTPDETKASLVGIVTAGDVFDNTTGIAVGTWDSYTITTATVPATGELQSLISMAAELGPDGDDVLFFQAALDRAGPGRGQNITDYDLAIVGGTGRYKGATGDVQHSGQGATSLDRGNQYLVEMAVPKFKRF